MAPIHTGISGRYIGISYDSSHDYRGRDDNPVPAELESPFSPSCSNSSQHPSSHHTRSQSIPLLRWLREEKWSSAASAAHTHSTHSDSAAAAHSGTFAVAFGVIIESWYPCAGDVIRDVDRVRCGGSVYLERECLGPGGTAATIYRSLSTALHGLHVQTASSRSSTWSDTVQWGSGFEAGTRDILCQSTLSRAPVWEALLRFSVL